MSSVFVFASKKMFGSEEALHAYLHPSYSKDGEMIPAEFMREVGLKSYEPMCVEAVRSDGPSALRDLVSEASYSDQWAHLIPEEVSADAVVLIYSPNVVTRPEGARMLQFHGAFPFLPKR